MCHVNKNQRVQGSWSRNTDSVIQSGNHHLLYNHQLAVRKFFWRVLAASIQLSQQEMRWKLNIDWNSNALPNASATVYKNCQKPLPESLTLKMQTVKFVETLENVYKFSVISRRRKQHKSQEMFRDITKRSEVLSKTI